MSSKKKKSHDDCLNSVCIVCMKKAKPSFKLSNTLYELFDRFIASGLDKNDPRLPKVICSSCKRALYCFQKDDFRRTVEVFDYSKLSSPTHITRLSSECACYVCNVAKFNNIISKSSATADLATKQDDARILRGKPSSVVTLCKDCLCQIGRGKPHQCTTSQRRENLLDLLGDSTPKCSDQVVSRTLKQKAESTNSNMLNLSQSGQPLKCELNPRPSTAPQIKIEQILALNHTLNISANKTLSLARELRYGSKNRKAIEPGLKAALAKNNMTADKMFTVVTEKFTSKEEVFDADVVICNDIRSVLETCISKRDLQFTKLNFKIGIDGGGGFLKVCLNILEEDNMFAQAKKKRRLFDDVKESHKDSSVQKLIIIALAPDVPENHENVSKIWNLLDLAALEDYGDVKVAADLKLCNLMLGLQSHACRHPCSWCDAEK